MVTVNNSDYYNNIPVGRDLNKLGRFDLSLIWTKSMDTYLNLPNANSKYK